MVDVTLRAERTPYSGVVGGGLVLKDPGGRARFILIVAGTTDGVTREESDAICEWLESRINASGALLVPPRSKSEAPSGPDFSHPLVGQRVVYWQRDQIAERGIVTSVNLAANVVFVRYENEMGSKATSPNDLTLLASGESIVTILSRKDWKP